MTILDKNTYRIEIIIMDKYIIKNRDNYYGQNYYLAYKYIFWTKIL